MISEREIGRFEGKLDTILENQKQERDAREKLEVRVRAVETSQANASGRSTIIGSIAAAVMAAVFTVAGRHYG